MQFEERSKRVKMHQLSLNEIKELELEMLIAFDRLCEETGLSYALCGGTLLGAIRHKGFIPWDDDIDVMMTRPEFKKLCSMIKTGNVDLPPHMKAISWFTEPSMDIPLVKIVDTRTTVEERYMNADKHLWIDIIPTDGCPENTRELSALYRKTKLLRKLLFAKQTRKGAGTTGFKALEKDIARTILKPVSGKLLCKLLEKVSTKYDFDKCDYIGCTIWGYGPQEKVDKKGWLSPIKVEFENHYFWGPSNYDYYLSNLYGDYMKLPPVEKRTSHEMVVTM